MGRNKKSQNNLKTLDLHGYLSDNVYDAVDKFIVKETKKGSGKIRIMTGKGKGIVQKLVVQYLKQGGYPWNYESKGSGQQNTGVLIVHLD